MHHVQQLTFNGSILGSKGENEQQLHQYKYYSFKSRIPKNPLYHKKSMANKKKLKKIRKLLQSELNDDNTLDIINEKIKLFQNHINPLRNGLYVNNNNSRKSYTNKSSKTPQKVSFIRQRTTPAIIPSNVSYIDNENIMPNIHHSIQRISRPHSSSSCRSFSKKHSFTNFVQITCPSYYDLNTKTVKRYSNIHHNMC